MRKAFLDLDGNYDGFIEVDDIVRYLSKEKIFIDYKLIQKVLIKKDSKKIGKLNYKDFNTWMCDVIEPPETFYFRHDDRINPRGSEVQKYNKNEVKIN